VGVEYRSAQLESPSTRVFHRASLCQAPTPETAVCGSVFRGDYLARRKNAAARTSSPACCEPSGTIGSPSVELVDSTKGPSVKGDAAAEYIEQPAPQKLRSADQRARAGQAPEASGTTHTSA
jgi:hypothetical protein